MGWEARFEEVRGLLARAQADADLGILEIAIVGLRGLAGEVTALDPGRVRVLANLGEALRRRFENGGELADLSDAIAAQREAAGLLAVGDERLPMVWRSLSLALQLRGEKVGGATAAADLEEAERMAAGAVEASERDDPMWAYRVHALAAAQRLRYQGSGVESYLTDALSNARRASEAAPGDQIIGSHLGIVLGLAYDRTGDIGLLNEAITACRAATTLEDSFHGSMIWNNLSTLLEARYARLGDSADLADAVAAARRAVDATDESNVNYGMYLSTLAEILRETPDSGDDAVPVARDAVRVTAASSPRLAARTALLARALLGQGTPESIEAAAEESRRAAAHTLASTNPDGQVLLVAAEAAEAGERAEAARAGEQTETARAGEQTEAARAGAQSKAVEYAQQALDVTGNDDPGRATVRLLLGALDPAHATDHFRAAAEQVGASPRTRCDAAERWALAARAEGRLDEAGTAYLRAVELLPAVATRGLGRPDRERQLEHRSTLAGDAVATALELDDATTALRLLETGRAVLHSQQLDLRTDLTALRHRDPEMADRLAGLAAVLDHDRLGH